MLFSELEKICGGTTQITTDEDTSIYSTDTRSLQGSSGEVFIALSGPSRNGHDFVDAASKIGVKNFIVEQAPNNVKINFLVVDNSVKALQKIATYHRNQFSIPIIGITGSNGKTTVKEWLFEILSKSSFVVKSPKSYNSQIGVPLSVLEIKSNHEIGVFEAGISQPNEMDKLQKIIQPTFGIFTTLGEAHSEGFSSSQEKLQEKLMLFREAKKMICRSDVEWFDEIRNHLSESKLLTWSLTGSSTYHVEWSEGKIKVAGVSYSTSLQHISELENVTHCIVTALEMGVSPEKIQEGLDSIKSVPMRLELKKGINGCFVLDDTYNNDLIGLRIAIDHLVSQKQNEKKTLILSDIFQTGRPDDELYTEVAELVKKKGFQRIIGVGKNISACEHLFQIEKKFFRSTKELLDDLPEFSNEMILVKGARDFQLEKVVGRIEEKNHGTVLEVNFESLRHNLRQYRNVIDQSTRMMVMVKANAYGSGISEVSNFLQHEKVHMLGVAYVDEAILLRQSGIDLPIMIMNPHVTSFSQFERFDLEAEIFSISHLNQLLRDVQNSMSIHLKIDTGMHRLGFAEEEIPQLVELLRSNPLVKVSSIFTHFSSSDSPAEDTFTHQQVEKFDKIYEQISKSIGYNPIRHACNSSAIVRFPRYHFEMVRLGIGLHGFDPSGKLDLRHTSTLKTIISQIQELPKGETVGYSRSGKLTRNSRIAVLPLGYEDGYLRVFGNGRANVIVNGKNCPTVGNICMDMTMVDVTDVDANIGDQVIIFGDAPGITDLARIAETIPYEILTNISSRVKRVFVSE